VADTFSTRRPATHFRDGAEFPGRCCVRLAELINLDVWNVTV
jgi:hypothetical protein